MRLNKTNAVFLVIVAILFTTFLASAPISTHAASSDDLTSGTFGGAQYTDITQYWTNDDTGIAAVNTGSNASLLQLQQANPDKLLEFQLGAPYVTVWSSKPLLSTGDGTMPVVDPTSTIKFVIHKTYDGSTQTGPLIDASPFGSGTFGSFTTVFSSAGVGYGDLGSDGNSSGITMTDSSGTALATTKPGYPSVGAANSSAAIAYAANGTDIQFNQDVVLTIDLKNATGTSTANKKINLVNDNTTQLSISEQWVSTADSTYKTGFLKMKIGTLNFSIILAPKVTNIIKLPQPIQTSDGQSIGAIVLGTGTVSGDTIYAGINADPSKLTADNADAPTAAKVNDEKKWLWLVPDSLAQKIQVDATNGIAVGELKDARDTSDNSSGELTDASEYLSGSGSALNSKLTDLINNTPSNGTISDDDLNSISQVVTQIGDAVALENEVAANTSIEMTPDSPAIAMTDKASIVKLGLVAESGDLSGASVVWTLNDKGTANAITDTNLSISGDSTDATVTAQPGIDLAKYSEGVDAIAKVTLSDGTVVYARRTVQLSGNVDLAVLSAPSFEFLTTDGKMPTLGDIIAGKYVDKALQATDANQEFEVSAPSGDWQITAKLSPFTNGTNELAPGTDGAATLNLTFSGFDGATQTSGKVRDNNTEQKVMAGNTTKNQMMTGTVNGTLNLEATPFVKPGTYTSTITWTAVSANVATPSASEN